MKRRRLTREEPSGGPPPVRNSSRERRETLPFLKLTPLFFLGKPGGGCCPRTRAREFRDGASAARPTPPCVRQKNSCLPLFREFLNSLPAYCERTHMAHTEPSTRSRRKFSCFLVTFIIVSGVTQCNFARNSVQSRNEYFVTEIVAFNGLGSRDIEVE